MLDEGKPATDFIKEEDMGGVDADTLKIMYRGHCK